MRDERLLVATDRSEVSAHAVRWAAALAERLGLRAVVVHAVEADEAGQDDEVAAWYHEAAGVAPAEVWVERGDVVTVLGRAATRRGAKMLVVSQSHRSTLEQLEHSRTQALAERPPCPTVVVHDDQDAPAGPVLVGVDLSETSLVAAHLAAELAERLEVPLTVLHIELTRREAGRLAPDQQVTIRRWAEGRLRELTEKLATRHPGLEILSEIQAGEAVEVLRVEGARAGLLVVGQTGLGRTIDALVGAVPRALLYRPPTTLLVVPRE